MSRPLTVSVPDETLADALRGIAGVDLVRWDLAEPPPRDSFDLVVPPYLSSPENLAALRGIPVGLVQYQSIGYDGVADHLPAGIPFANAATVHETSTAELAVGLALAMQREIPRAVRTADRGTWDPYFSDSLADRRVLLVGYGGVSKAIESRLAPFEVGITRIARHGREDRNLAGDAVRVHGIDDLHEFLTQTDIAILAVPLTDATRGLIDARALATLPDGALIVNVSRGPVVNTDDLVQALRAGRIRAALDVVDPEPLPDDHALWDFPGVLITPHVGGASSALLPRMVALIRRQIARLQTGDEPENVVIH